MILLETERYNKIIEPLHSVTINNLFARAVVEKKLFGKIYVDNQDNPKTYYVIHPYGMTLLFGDWSNDEFNVKFKGYALNENNVRNIYPEWMQVFPHEWNDTLFKLFGNKLVNSKDNKEEKGIIELNTRVNFKFNYEKYRNRVERQISDIEIIRTDGNVFDNMPGSVVPRFYYNNKNDFLENGIGFSLFYKKQLAATTFAAWIIDNKLEIGIETIKEFQGKGFAEMVCQKIIEYCIQNNYEPIWSCRLENIGSCVLAEKLGFEPILKIPYYKLSK